MRVDGVTYTEGDPCLDESCSGQLVPRETSPTPYRPPTPMLACSMWPVTKCETCVFVNRIRVGNSDSNDRSSSDKAWKGT